MLIRSRYLTAGFIAFALAAETALAQYTPIILPMPAGATSAKALAASQGQQVGISSVSWGRAILWNGASGSQIDLTVGKLGSFAYAARNGYQGGAIVATTHTTSGSGRGGGGSRTYAIPHACFWHGSAGSGVDLNPSGMYESAVQGLNASQQVGWAMAAFQGIPHAYLWSGTAASAVALEPAGFSGSEATALDGAYQVGYGYAPSGSHALLWNGTAASGVDLHPTSFSATSSFALAEDATANQQAGACLVLLSNNGQYYHACVWNGTAASAVDLTPTSYSAQALATKGGYQAGYAQASNFQSHAMLWHGTAASAVDLHSFLPSTYTSSQANGIDQDGSIVGTASDGIHTYPVVWVPTAENILSMSQSDPPGASGWSTANVAVTLTSPFPAAGSSISYSVNGTWSWSSGNNVTVPLSLSGTYQITAFASNRSPSGTKTTPARMYTVNIDVTPPVTLLSYAGNVLTLTGTDANSGVAVTNYTLDGGSTLTYTNPVPLTNVNHTVVYWSTDRAGNVETKNSTTLPASAPSLTSIAPNSVRSGTGALTLTVKGAGFLPGSVVQWNGSARTTTYVSSTQLTASITAADVASAGTASVTVNNPAPGTGTSAPQAFTIVQTAIAQGTLSNLGDGGALDIGPVSSYSGFTLNGQSVHVQTSSSTTFQDANGNYMSASTFFDTTQEGVNVKVVGTYDSVNNVLNAVSVQLQ